MIEYVDIYDNFRKKTGKIIPRSQRIPRNFYKLIIHACIFNNKNEMLIQKRQKIKRAWPNLWDMTVAGGVISGEDSQTTVQRELEEELSIKYDFSKKCPDLSMKSEFRIDDVYLVDDIFVDINKLVLQEDEVSDVMWASLNKILELKKKKEFIPYNESYLKILFFLKNNKNIFEN